MTVDKEQPRPSKVTRQSKQLKQEALKKCLMQW